MSYILDALRRADSERERGAVPTINAQPLAVDGGDDKRPRNRLWLWLVAAVGLVLLGALASRMLMQSHGESHESPALTRAVQADAPPSGSSSAVTAQTLAQAGPPTTSPTTAPPAPQLAPQVAPQTTPPARVSTALAVTKTSLGAAPSPAGLALQPAAPAASVAVSGQVAAAPASAPGDRPVPTLKELPDAIRRELPALVTGGSMYSDTPAARMIILKGQVFHEGDTVAPNLVLEQIKPRGAVLSFKGYRYSIGY